MKEPLKSFIFVLILILLFYLSRVNFLLFHIVVELYAILIGLMIYILSTSSYKFVKNDYFTFLGTSYLFVSLIDFIHTLIYKGMNIFSNLNSANYPTQAWIMARYMESISLFLAPIFLKRRLKVFWIYLIYLSVFVYSIFSIFYFRNFPVCYVDGKGLTNFKIISEYIISLILLVSAYFHWKKREYFDPYVLKLLILSIFTTIISETFFTLYVDVYGVMNALGHIFKLISFYLIYLSIVETSIKSPYRTLFYEFLKESRSFKDYIEYAGVIFLVLDINGNILLINKRGEDILGYEKKDIIGKNWFESFVPENLRERLREYMYRLISENNTLEDRIYENPIITKEGERIIRWHNTLIRDERNKVVGILSSGEDITEEKIREEVLKYFASIDPLTEVYNKRMGIEILEKELHLSLLRKSPLSLVFIDIDNLKYVNDNCGHNEGDEYLKIVAQVIKSNIRKTDTVFRFGGDEFVLIFPFCDREIAQNIINKILENLNNLGKSLNKPYNLSFSYGISVFNFGDKKDINDLIREADLEMYNMKKNSRNIRN